MSTAPEEHSAAVTLYSGEVLQLELAGDLGGGNVGMLISWLAVSNPTT